MVDESDRMARASKYVLGLMNEDERARAERDLEHDTAFRDAMIQVAERMHLFDLTKPQESTAPALWKSITAHLGVLPHIRGAEPAESASKARSPAAGRAKRLGAGWCVSILALSLLAASGVGYAAGRVGGGTAPADCGSVAQ
ncbi:MAG: hypothetical protein WBA88_20215 [Pseudaminobacter sp.]